MILLDSDHFPFCLKRAILGGPALLIGCGGPTTSEQYQSSSWKSTFDRGSPRFAALTMFIAKLPRIFDSASYLISCSIGQSLIGLHRRRIILGASVPIAYELAARI